MVFMASAQGEDGRCLRRGRRGADQAGLEVDLSQEDGGGRREALRHRRLLPVLHRATRRTLKIPRTSLHCPT